MAGIRDEAAQAAVRGVAGLERRFQVVEHRVHRAGDLAHLRLRARELLRQALAQHGLPVGQRQSGDAARGRRDLLERAQRPQDQECCRRGDDEDAREDCAAGRECGPGDEAVRVVLRQAVDEGRTLQVAGGHAIDDLRSVEIQTHRFRGPVSRHGGEL